MPVLLFVVAMVAPASSSCLLDPKPDVILAVRHLSLPSIVLRKQHPQPTTIRDSEMLHRSSCFSAGRYTFGYVNDMLGDVVVIATTAAAVVTARRRDYGNAPCRLMEKNAMHEKKRFAKAAMQWGAGAG